MAVDTLRRAYAAEVDPLSVPPRSMARGPGTWLRCLTAISPLGGHLGCKQIAASPRTKRASYLVSLFEPETMRLAALMDGAQITGIRTAATAVVAVDAMAPAKPLRVAILGSGFEAKAQWCALRAIRDIESVSVFSPTAANRQRFATELGAADSIPMRAADSAEAAVRGADLVICAARARSEIPVLKGDWLEPGMTLVSVGSTLPEQREVDVGVLERSDLIVADMVEEVAHDTGDLQAAKQQGLDLSHKLISLSDLISGKRRGRKHPADILLYKSVGGALQDVVIAELLFQQATGRGVGSELGASVVPVAK
ncbi:MAG TPA: ornithine cyclodeaminase family protein [Steroidobacteraceae bacterium]|nr:ornithine cyclodeaminase family protein [Steroidobacteraceae bacterium]